MKTLYLIDGMALVYRSYYALLQANLKSQTDEPTGAVYGFTATLMKLLDDHRPDHIAVVFDTAAPTFRHEKFAAYKAQRPPMPEDMKPQIGYIKEVVKGFDIPVLEIDGFEADDLIGTLAVKAADEGVRVRMVTPDKDYMQLVTDRIGILRPTSKNDSGFEEIDHQAVADKFGVSPDQVIEVLGLMGDSADNVPGVPGIGEKTAIKLIQEHGSIANAIAAAKANPKGKVMEKLVEFEQLAYDCRELVTIDTRVPIDLDWHRLKVTAPNTQDLIRLFQHLNFRTFRQKLETAGQTGETGDLFSDGSAVQDGKKTIQTEEHDYQIVRDPVHLKAYLSQRPTGAPLCFDLETDQLDPLLARPVGIALSVKARTGIYMPVNADSDADIQEKLEWVRPFLTDASIPKLAQNGKFDLLILERFGLTVTPFSFDTMIAAFVLNSNQPVGMDDLAEKYLNYRPVPITDLIGSGKNQLSMKNIAVEKVADYAAEDADITLQLYQVFEPDLRATGTLGYCEKVDFPLVPVLTTMERLGVKIDTDFLKSLSHDMTGKLLEFREQIFQAAGFEFNVNSPKQLSDVLFNKLGLPPSKKTQTGFSTDQSVLEGLRFAHPIIESILNFRQVDKLKGTYVDALPTMVNPETGRVHSTFSQTIAATGRLSSNNPNLQNIPIRTDLGREIRKAFIPGEEGWVILSADYSQIELRIVAAVAGDEAMTSTFKAGIDIHTGTAARVFGVDPSAVTRDMRRKAKEVNFGIIYGISAFGLANRLGIPQGEARDIINRYFTTYPKIKQYMETIVGRAKADGYVETLLGRRRYLPDIRSGNRTVQQMAERMAINSPIQGTAADLIKLAMIDIDRWLKSTPSLKTRMILQVHDELVFEVPESEVDLVKPDIIGRMESAFQLPVPLVVEAGTGANWLDAH